MTYDNLVLLLLIGSDPRLIAELEAPNGPDRPDFDWWEPRYNTPDRRLQALARRVRDKLAPVR